MGEVGTGPHPDRGPVEGARLRRGRRPSARRDALVDDAEHRPAVTQQADQGAEGGPADDESLGAVDRIEAPHQLGLAMLAGELLALDAVVGKPRPDQVAHDALGLAIGDRDRALVGLVVDRDRCAIVAAAEPRPPDRRVRGRMRDSRPSTAAALGLACQPPSQAAAGGYPTGIADTASRSARSCALLEPCEGHLGTGRPAFRVGHEVVHRLVVPGALLLAQRARSS